MGRKSKTDKAPKVHPDLEGFEIKVNNFGQLETNFDIERINEFLNKNVDDKKLRDRDDVEHPQKPK